MIYRSNYMKLLANIYYLSKNLVLMMMNRTTRISLSARIRRINNDCNYVKIGSKSYFNGRIGSYSYIGDNCIIRGSVGRFCSISNNVKVIVGSHPTNFLSTSPVFYSNAKQCGTTFTKKSVFDDYMAANKDDNIACVIGNDVWIGDDVLIKGGVIIGDGAIIGMGSVVTKNVPPYAIVAGAPAKIIRFRFDESVISILCQRKWWDEDERWLKEHLEYFQSEDGIKQIMDYYGK